MDSADIKRVLITHLRVNADNYSKELKIVKNKDHNKLDIMKMDAALDQYYEDISLLRDCKMFPYSRLNGMGKKFKGKHQKLNKGL